MQHVEEPLESLDFRCRQAKSRALRRHHAFRLRRTRARYWAGYASASPEAASKVVSTPCLCSGFCCGNPRAHTGEVTRQELCAALSAREQLLKD